MTEKDSELLNTVYREIADKLGIDTALNVYRMFKGQQICFPVRFFSPTHIQKLIIAEYDGSNIRTLSAKYNYSERTIRRILREHKNIKLNGE